MCVDFWVNIWYYTSCGCETHPQENKMQEWRNWQTRRLQVPVVAIS